MQTVEPHRTTMARGYAREYIVPSSLPRVTKTLNGTVLQLWLDIGPESTFCTREPGENDRNRCTTKNGLQVREYQWHSDVQQRF